MKRRKSFFQIRKQHLETIILEPGLEGIDQHLVLAFVTLVLIRKTLGVTHLIVDLARLLTDTTVYHVGDLLASKHELFLQQGSTL